MYCFKTNGDNYSLTFDVHIIVMQHRLLWIFLALISFGLTSNAQDQDTVRFDKVVALDSVEMRYNRDLCDTLPELVDSIFNVLKTKKFDKMIPYMPTADMLSEQFDSMELTQLQRLAIVKQQYWVNNLRKQHIILLKDAKVLKFNLRNMELVKTRIRIKEMESGVRYGEVTYLCKSKDTKVYITFLAMELVGKWFIGDELRMVLV